MADDAADGAETHTPAEGRLEPYSTTRRVERAMANEVLGSLYFKGAASVDQLLHRNISLLGVTLHEDELVVLVEDLRTWGLIEPLGHREDALGRPITDTEWALTTHGRETLERETRRFRLWTRLRPEHAGSTVKYGRALTPVLVPALGGLGVAAALVRNWPLLVIAVMVAAWAVLMIGGLLETLHGSRVAREWPRAEPGTHPTPGFLYVVLALVVAMTGFTLYLLTDSALPGGRFGR